MRVFEVSPHTYKPTPTRNRLGINCRADPKRGRGQKMAPLKSVTGAAPKSAMHAREMSMSRRVGRRNIG
jgi:hypothetical protein